MGDLIPLDGMPEKPSRVTPGQALYAKLVDVTAEMGMGKPPPTILVRVVKAGRECLEHGVEPAAVLQGCIAAIVRARPDLTETLIGEVVAARAGVYMTPKQWEQQLRVLSQENDPGWQQIEAAYKRAHGNRKEE